MDPRRARRARRAGGRGPGPGPPERRRERGPSDPGRRRHVRRELFALDMARNLVVGLAGAGGRGRDRHCVVPDRAPRRGTTGRGLHRDRVRLARAPARSAGHRGGRPGARHLAGPAGGAHPADGRAGRAVPLLGGGAAPGHPGRAADRGDRRPQRPGAPIRRVRRSAGLRAPGHGAGGHRVVRDGGLRRQPDPPDGDAPALWRPGAAQLHAGEPRPAQPAWSTTRPSPPSPRASARGTSRSTGRSSGGIDGTSVKGPLLFSTVAGTLPVGDDQVGLGVSTMHQLGARIGSVVRHHVHHAFRCPPHRAVPGRLPDLLPAVRGVREPRHGDPD